MNPFSACMYENRYSATRLFKSPASLTLWTAARAFAVVVGGGVVVGAGVVVVVGSGVVVVVGSGVVVVGSSVVTTRLLASFWPAKKWRQKSIETQLLLVCLTKDGLRSKPKSKIQLSHCKRMSIWAPLTCFHISWSGGDVVQGRWIDHSFLGLPHCNTSAWLWLRNPKNCS